MTDMMEPLVLPITRVTRARTRVHGDNAALRHKRHYGFASATNARIVMVCSKVAIACF
jgi:hypothetical protein